MALPSPPIAQQGGDIDVDQLYRRIALLESRSQDPSSVAITGGSVNAFLSPAFRSAVNVGTVFAATLGASITAGTGSSNAGTTAYTPMVGKAASNRRILRSTPAFGYAGQTAAFVASQVSTALAAKPDLLILGPDFGTNSAAASATDVYGSFGQYVLSVVQAARSIGTRVVACLTLPQGSGATATTQKGINAQNQWLAAVASKVGIDLIDTHSPMLDQTTGLLAAANDSGDNVHPNDTGHALIATTIGAWIDANLPALPWPVGVGAAGLITNPLMVGAANNLYAQTISPSTFTGTATHSRVARVDATDLPAGRWHQANCDATTAGGALRTGSLGIAVTPGETVYVFGYIKSSGTGQCDAIIWNDSAFAIASTMLTTTNGGASVPFATRFTVPAGCTTMRVGMNLTTTVGQNLNGFLGAYDVIRPSNFTNGQ